MNSVVGDDFPEVAWPAHDGPGTADRREYGGK